MNLIDFSKKCNEAIIKTNNFIQHIKGFKKNLFANGVKIPSDSSRHQPINFQLYFKTSCLKKHNRKFSKIF